MDLTKQTVSEERFGQDPVCAGSFCLILHIIPVITGKNDDDSFTLIEGTYRSGEFNAVHFRHLIICQDQLIGSSLFLFSLYAAKGFSGIHNIISTDPDRISDQNGMFTGHDIVVYHQHPRTFGQDIRMIITDTAAGCLHCHRDGESGADILFAVDLNFTVHHFHDVFSDRHTETRTAVFICSLRILL